MIKKGRWPKEFKDVIPQKVKDFSEDEYSQFDRNLYPEI
jgi:hypothetical protein